MPSPVSVRRAGVSLTLCCTLLVGATACGSDDKDTATAPSGTSTAEKQKFAKTRFVANAGLAAGATYQWIVKPYRAGKFKKGANGRTTALVKAGLAGAFTYNRLKAATKNAQGDPTLSKAVAPLTAGIDALKDLPGKLRKGESTDSIVNSFDGAINSVKDAGKSAGAEVKDKVPSTGQLRNG
ncbi:MULTISPECIES: hypothetical protein [unclassified Streptomyces]|uniref:hypothetical protein n=1 Tax=unclassified Streptomyces TaxID=2593676 RepID=UPI001CC051E0|nr:MULTISPECIES: hypothetical protein [unclassified Streptomyces]WPO74094.1 hypothetical protein R9806_27485 [Streptomyces sp. KN37]